MNLFTWINELLGTENAESIIAISALLAWMLPKLLYFGVKFIFNTLLFLANVFSRDKLELWLKNKINYFLASLAHGAKVSDIPRWLNKDQLALREVHWQRAGLVVDVPSVIVTINLPSFGYNVFKLKLRDIRLAFKAGDSAQITGLEGEYRIIKPTIKAWRSFEVPHSLEGVLSWNEQGLALPDNFLVFKNGLRLRIPCEWQDGRLKMNFPTLDDLKQRYLGIVQQAKEAAKSYFGKLW